MNLCSVAKKGNDIQYPPCPLRLDPLRVHVLSSRVADLRRIERRHVKSQRKIGQTIGFRPWLGYFEAFPSSSPLIAFACFHMHF
jgi:hypothetical protein